MNKKIFTALLCACMISAIPFSASAKDNNLTEEITTVTEEVKSDFYYEYLSKETGFTVKKLKEYEAEIGEDLYSHWNIALPTANDLETLQSVKLDEDEADLSITSSSGGTSTGTYMTPTQ